MSGEHPKSSSSFSASSDAPPDHPPGIIHLPPHPNSYPLPPGVFPPVFFGLPHAEGVGNHDAAGPYPLPYPPMMYLYPQPPPGQAGSPFAHPAIPAPPPTAKPKRKQVKMACTNCASACKKCDDERPCRRCIKTNIQPTCKDGVRKERKKGVKRGPYKRKNRTNSEDESEGGTHAPAHSPPIMQFPEGYVPYFFPPPPGYFQGDSGPNGGPPPPQFPFYPYHHFTPFSYPGGLPIPYPSIISQPPLPLPPPPPSGGSTREHEAITHIASTKGKKRLREDEDSSSPTMKKTKLDVAQSNGYVDAADNHSVDDGSVSTFSRSGSPELD